MTLHAQLSEAFEEIRLTVKENRVYFWLSLASAVDSPDQQETCRLSDVKLRYTHLDAVRLRDAVAALPNLDTPGTTAEARATGTDGGPATAKMPSAPQDEHLASDEDSQDCLLSCLLSEDGKTERGIDSDGELDAGACLFASPYTCPDQNPAGRPTARL